MSRNRYQATFFAAVFALLAGVALGQATSTKTNTTNYPIRAMLAHRIATATDGGNGSTGAWTTRPINTEVYDPSGIVTLSSNQFTLGAGTYHIVASQSFCSGAAQMQNFSRLRDMTNTATLALGDTARVHAGSGNSVELANRLDAVITLTGSTVIELQYWIKASDGGGYDLGFANAVNTGEQNQYVTVMIEQLRS